MASKSRSGAGSLKADIRAWERRQIDQIKAAVDRSSHLLGDQVEANAPVDSGRTRDSVQVKPVRRSKGRITQVVSVGAGRGSGHDVGAIEYGTQYQEANPFFRRSIGETESRRRAMIEKAT
jgi:HK97 gp10 family phage protein